MLGVCGLLPPVTEPLRGLPGAGRKTRTHASDQVLESRHKPTDNIFVYRDVSLLTSQLRRLTTAGILQVFANTFWKRRSGKLTRSAAF